MLAFLYSIFGCSTQSAPKGPDFEHTIDKVLHINQEVRIHYSIPKNLSTMFNYAERYENETSRSVSVPSLSELTIEPHLWRDSHEIDGGMWDYIGSRKQGLGGDMGGLHFHVSIDKKPSQESTEAFVNRSLDEYLNGSDGINTDVRNSEMGKGLDDEELGHWIIKSPTPTESTIAGVPATYYTLDWQNGKQYQIYLVPLSNPEYLVCFTFYYTVSSQTIEEHEQQTARVLEDIERIKSLIKIEQK